MLLPDSAEERRWINSILHASPLVLQVPLCRHHPKVEITAPASIDIKNFVGNILLALVLLREAEGSEKFFQ